MAESSKKLKPDADYMNNVVEAVLHGYAPKSPEFHDFLGTPNKPKGMIDQLRIGLFGMTEDEETAKQRRIFENKIGEHAAAGFADALTKLKLGPMMQQGNPSLEAIASGFGGNLPASIAPTGSQVQPYAGGTPAQVPSVEGPMLAQGLSSLQPSAQELAMLTKRSGEFEPLLQINPNAPANIPQLQTLEALRAGHIFDPTSGIIPPSLAASATKPIEVSPGATLYDPRQKKGIYTAPKTETQEKIVNPVDQRVGVLSKGKFRTLQDALDAGDIKVAEQAEKDVRETRPVLVAGATGVQAQQIAQNAPLPQGERKNLFDRKAFLSTGELKRLPAGISKGAAARSDVLEIDDKQLENMAMLQGSIASVRGMFDMADEIITAKTPVEAAQQYAALKIGAATKSNAAAATYQSTKDAFTTTTARQVGQERGVLTDQDVLRWSRTLPSFGDTVQVKEKKRMIFNRILNATVQANRSIIAGDDPKTVIQKTHKLLDPLMRQAEGFGQSSLGNLTPMEAAMAKALKNSGKSMDEVEAIILQSRQKK